MTLLQQQPSGHEPPDAGEKPCWFCDDDSMVPVISARAVSGRVHELPEVKEPPEMPCPVCRLGMVL